jgi:AAA domain
MGLFRPAEITTAKLKMALMGFQGSGKTFTATDISIGLVKLMCELKLPEGGKPIYFADTERGSRWVLPKVHAAGLPISTAHTRAFADLCGIINEAEANASVLLIDSLTHFWTEFCDTYAAQKAEEYHRQTYRLQFQDWAFLKAKWRTFTDRFVNSNLHIVVAGRAGYEYDMIEDDDTHKKQLEKTGIKFKAEGEMGYEPDLLVLMERRMNMDTKADEHIAHVVKDRSTLLDGQEFIDPTFKHFLPHIQCLNLDAGRTPEISIDTTRTSAAAIPAGEPRDRTSMQRAIIVEEINDLLMRHGAGGTSAADKLKRSDLMQKHFGTVSKTKIEDGMSLFELKAGYDSLHLELEGKPSRYGAPKIEQASVVQTKEASIITVGEAINDSLPDSVMPEQRISDDVRRKIEQHVDNILAAG